MRRTIKITLLITAAALIMTLGSCSKWLNPGEETRVVWATILTSYDLPLSEEYPYYFITDDTLLYCPMNHTSINDDFEPIDGQRLILYYKFHSTTTQVESDQEETLEPGTSSTLTLYRCNWLTLRISLIQASRTPLVLTGLSRNIYGLQEADWVQSAT